MILLTWSFNIPRSAFHVPHSAGPVPDDWSGKLWASKDGQNCSASDHLPKGASSYGQIMKQPLMSYTAGSDVVSVALAGSNPINNAYVGGSYFEVQLNSSTGWSTVAVDADWETRLIIQKSKVAVVETARVWVVEWRIPATAAAGEYRVRVRGSACTHGIVASSYTPFVSTTQTFGVAASGGHTDSPNTV